MHSSSTTLSASLPSSSATARLLLPLAALHAAMLVYDLAHPERFLRADRALERMGAIEKAAQYTSHGIVGDWLPQAILWHSGGQYFVIAVQIILALASVLWVRDIGLRIGLSGPRAAAAAGVYALLPHTLVFPHQLASEAIFMPLVVLGFRLGTSPGGGLALGLAALVRPVTLLWPLLQAMLGKASFWRCAGFVTLALAPLVAWVGVVHHKTGEYSMGRSGHDLGSNLYYRMQRMAPDAAPQKPEGERRASVLEYLRFVAAHPARAAAHSARDLLALTLKSGIERVTLDYLDLFPQAREGLQDPAAGWRASVESRGAIATFVDLLKAQPGLVLSSLVASALFVILLALAVCGAWRLGNPNGLVLGAFVLYIAATAQGVDAAQSRHRAPAEFALCLLALAAWPSGRKGAPRVR